MLDLTARRTRKSLSFLSDSEQYMAVRFLYQQQQYKILLGGIDERTFGIRTIEITLLENISREEKFQGGQ